MPLSNRRSRILILAVAAVIAAALYIVSAPGVHAATHKYMLKVNSKRNVITAYKKVNGKWKAVRAMLCSCGTGGYSSTGLSYSTKSGTYKTGSKARWLHMSLNGVDDYAQYTAHVYGGVYIHAVWCYKPRHNAQSTYEYNRLGTNASHGCIRVSTMDAKWIYKHCPSGTVVKIYKSSKAGPLGKPKPVKNPSSSVMSWDPTDPAKGNPNFRMRRTVITIKSKKKEVVQYGSSFKAKAYVSAKDTNAIMNVTPWITVKYYKYKNGKYRRIKRISTKSLGTYKIVYRTGNYDYAPSGRKTFKFKVVDYSKPVIKGAKDVTGTVGTYDLSSGITASQKSCSLTSRILVSVKKDGEYLTKRTSIKNVKAYEFSEAGTYYVYYRVANKYKAGKYRVVRVTYTITDPETDSSTDTTTDTTTTTTTTTASAEA